MEIVERFESYILIRGPDECWEWLGSKVPSGYGRFVVAEKRKVYAHRFAYAAFYGPIPKDKQILHRCDIPSCCNPHHLFCGTNKDNMVDMQRKERQPNRKLSWNQVSEIRGLNSKGKSVQALSDQFLVSRRTIGRVIRGTRWNQNTD